MPSRCAGRTSARPATGKRRLPRDAAKPPPDDRRAARRCRRRPRRSRPPVDVSNARSNACCAARLVFDGEARGVHRGALAAERDAVARDALELARELGAALAQLRLRVEVARERAARALDAHRVRDERVEAAADGQQPGARELVEGAPAHERRARAPRRSCAPSSPSSLFESPLLGVEIGDVAVERGERERRRAAPARRRRAAARGRSAAARGADAARDERRARGRRRSRAASYRHQLAEARAPRRRRAARRGRPSPSATGQGRNVGSTPTSARELAVEPPAHDEEERAEERDGADRAEPRPARSPR